MSLRNTKSLLFLEGLFICSLAYVFYYYVLLMHICPIAVYKIANHIMKGCLSQAQMPQMANGLTDVTFLMSFVFILSFIFSE